MGTHYGYEQGHPAKTLHIDCWLTIGRGAPNGFRRPTVKVTAGYPELKRNERALNLKIALPIALFEAPSLSATINVEEPAQGIKIDTTAIAEAVRGVIGADVTIEVKEPDID